MEPDKYEEHEGLSFKDLFVPFTNVKAIVYLAIVGFAVFFNSFFNGFALDDFPQIVDNPVVHSMNIPAFFQGSTFYMGPGVKLEGAYYRPFVSIFVSFIYSIFGSSAGAFHFFQVLLFITNACLLFLFLKHFFKSSIAFVLALLFLIHPINSENAFYIANMQDVLFFFFGIIALLLLKNVKSQVELLSVSLCLLASIFSKETGILFFAISLVYTYIYKRIYILPLFACMLISFFVYFPLRAAAIGEVAQNAPIQLLDLPQRLLNTPDIFLYYIKTFFFPLQLSQSYLWVHTTVTVNNFFLPLLSVLLFASLLVLLGTLIRRKSHSQFQLHCFFAIWFFIGILAHSQIVPLDQTVAEHWFYFPIIGLMGILGVLAHTWHLRVNNKYVVAILLIICILLSVRTFSRSYDWRNEYALASRDIQVSPDSHSLHYSLSHYYSTQGKHKEAIIHAQKSIDLFPTIINYTYLGNAYFYTKDLGRAEEAYLQALKLGDNYYAYVNLATVYINTDPLEALSFVPKAVEKYPLDATLWYKLAVLEYTYGDRNKAKAAIERAYMYNKSTEFSTAYNFIMNDTPLNVQQ